MIGFLQPLALVALVAAAIPALLHLLGRRLPPTVVFPAVRYLTATEREHSRRLRFRNLLLLILRTAAIVFLVLAASRPVVRAGSGASHPPTALALIVDNSLSSGAVLEGRRTLDTIVAAAREVVARTNVDDRLWIVLSDGIPQRKTRLEAIETLADLSPSTSRMDLGAAVSAAARAIADDPLPDGPVVILSDLQASALPTGTDVAQRILVWEQPPSPMNRWLDSVYAQPEIWTPSGGVVASVGGYSSRPVALRLEVQGVELARTLASPGERAVLSATLRTPGWAVASVRLDPDEMRADDTWSLALLRAEPAAVRWDTAVGDFLVEALEVLRQGGRVSSGSQVTLGSVSQTGVSVIFPPTDPSLVGALNRTLNSLGVTWQFADLVSGEWALSDESGIGEGIEIYRRYRLRGTGDVFAAVGRDPWLVRSNRVVLVGSRMEPQWTRLPLSAAFVPFVDYLINRTAARESWIVAANPGDVVELPPSAGSIVGSGSSAVIAVPANRRVVAPPETGVYFLRSAGGDTVGALEVNPDVRESRLEVADVERVRAAFGEEAQVMGSTMLLSELFGGEGQIDLTTVLLILALIAAAAEFSVASYGGHTRAAS